METIEVSRYEDMWDWILKISQKENTIEIGTVPAMDSLTFTWSWGQSDNTYKSLKKLFRSMEQDNKESPQENNIDEYDCQSRSDDGWKPRIWLLENLVISNYADVKVTVTSDDKILFKNTSIWWMSKHTYETAKELVLAMQKDNEERPQHRIN